MLATCKKICDQPRQHIKKQGHLLTKVHIVKAMVFLVIMCGCESWSIKKAECQRINAFKMWCWRRLLRVPCTARRSNQWILKEINHEYSLEGLMLKLQYLGHLMERVTHWKRPWCWERQGKKRRERQRIRWLDSITDSMDMNLSNSGRWWRIGEPGMLQSMGS